MTSVLVFGSGIAGLTCALHAVRHRMDVVLVTKAAADQGATRYAQGGIAGVVFPEDHVEAHIADTLAAGAGLCDERAVRVLVTEGPDRIRELVRRGVAFDRDAAGRLRRGLEGAHSFPRILHAGGDATGLAIEQALLRAVREAGVGVLEHASLVDLAVADGAVEGARVLVDGRELALSADAVVLATGGAGQLYARTTSPAVATGDGIAAALRAGAETRHLEFVQFHPTVLAADHDARAAGAFLISEAVRGEGAVLLDERGRRFAHAAHLDGELAPRDVVARAIAATMAAQDGRPVRLDATRLGARTLRTRFPSIDAALRERGLDWASEPVPVAPAAHYFMGGVRTDLWGRTTVAGLYAVGETAATGAHGANRLASNSLLEGAVFGARAAAAIARGRAATPVAMGDPTAHPPAPAPAAASADRGAPFSRVALQRLMWQDVGLLRDAAGLDRAARTIAAWRRTRAEGAAVPEREDGNLLLVAEAVVAAARARRTSVGAHFRRDAPAAARAARGRAVPARPVPSPAGAPC
ncbi:L-aspartate oxidase [Microbacterium album]|uniref:L-aspartate oxidase n=1 Tax=Microbacterium album TaxID=2053191 RepID=A0A917MQ20_9MICO|nr:L-aspartate oxidase [Microbacterium album]GGH49786.1 L-aspartate oxidase [Microbacterium album]